MNHYSLIPMIIKRTLAPLREFEKSFSNFWRKEPTISYVEEGIILPEIDINETEKEYHVTVGTPGLQGKDIRIEFNKGLLILRGEKKTEKEENRSNKYHISEKSCVYFNHTIHLPNEIDESNVTARMKDGVIDITLSKLKETEYRNKLKNKPRVTH